MTNIIMLVFTVMFLLLLGNCATDANGKNPNMIKGDPTLYAVPSLALHAEGNKLLNENNKEVRLVGVNIPSLEWNSYGENVLLSVYEAFTNWNCNVIRLPVDQDRWFGKVYDPAQPWADPFPSDGGAGYKKLVDDVVKLVSDFGKYVIIDNHWYVAPSEDSLVFWKDAAERYKNNPAVLFGLCNEPHSITWDVWRDGGDTKKGFIAVGHQRLVEEIRASGANNIIVAGGLDWGYDLSGIANGFALEDTSEGSGIMYDAHAYPWKSPDNMNNNNNKVLLIADKYPILIGEFGMHNEPMPGIWNSKASDYPDWMPMILDWMDTNNLNFTAWSFHVGASPVIISNWQYKPTPWFGEILKTRLLSYPDNNAHLETLPGKPAR